MRLLIGVDPGKLTGLAAINLDDGSLHHWEASLIGAGDWVRYWITSQPVSRVVVERFVPTRKVMTWQPDALEVTGMLRYMCVSPVPPIPFELQDRAVRERVSPAALKELGWAKLDGSTGHARDALRHALAALVRYEPEHDLAQRLMRVVG